MYKLILTNRNLNAYKIGKDEVILKADLLKNSVMSYKKDVTVHLYMNYKTKGGSYSLEKTAVTDDYGSVSIKFPTDGILDVNNCNAKVTCVINSIEIVSNIVRLNFIASTQTNTIITAGTCNIPEGYDRSDFMILDGSHTAIDVIYERGC